MIRAATPGRLRTPAMKAISVALALLCLAAAPAWADNTAQQQRMADCSHKNKGLTGDAYKNAQKACLAGKGETGGNAQQERMKKCNADAGAKQLSGDARKTFMSSCLKAS